MIVLANYDNSFIVEATVITIVNYDCAGITFLNYDHKTFIVQATVLPTLLPMRVNMIRFIVKR
jgi:hypothetical protein